MISVLYNIILITNFKLIEMCIKSSPKGEGDLAYNIGEVFDKLAIHQSYIV